MEKHTMFVDQKNQYSENEYTRQSNLWIQCNPYQAANGIFQRTRTNNFTTRVEIQKKPWIAKAILRKNLESNWKNQPAWLQTILQSYSQQDSMILVQRQKYRSMEQNRKHRDKSMHLWTSYLWRPTFAFQSLWWKWHLFGVLVL